MELTLFSRKKDWLIFIVFINVLLLLWYIFYGYQHYFHSDSAAQYLLAKEAIKQGRYLVPDWTYANGDIWAFYNNIFLIPVMLFGAKGYFAFALSRILPAFLVLLGSYCVSTMLTDNRKVRMVSLAVIAGGVSPWLAENLYGQISYGTYFYISCFLIFFTWKYLESRSRPINVWLIAIILILGVSFWTNPKRSVAIYFIPLLLSLVTTFQLGFKARSFGMSKKMKYLLFGLLIASVVGCVLYVVTLIFLNPSVGDLGARWLSFSEMMSNVGYTIQGLLGIFGALPSAGAKVVSGAGIYWALRLLMGLMLLIMLPLAVLRGFSHPKKSVAFVTRFVAYSFLIVLFFQLTTTLPKMVLPVLASRYLVPSVLLMLILFICTQFSFPKGKKHLSVLAGSFVIVMLVTSGHTAFIDKSFIFQGGHVLPKFIINKNKRFAKFLASNGLHYGYATFWNAGAVTVFSADNVKVRQVWFSNGLPVPMRWLASDAWYESESWEGKTFVAIIERDGFLLEKYRVWSEKSLLNLNKLERYLKQKPVKILSFEDKKIYVFNKNIAAALPGWTQKFNTKHTFQVRRDSLKQIGRVSTDKKPIEKKSLRKKERKAFCFMAPMLMSGPGSYNVTFDLRLAKAIPNSVRLDVVSRNGAKKWGVLTWPNVTPTSTIHIKIDRPEILEFRVFSQGKSKVIFKGVSIKRVSSSLQN